MKTPSILLFVLFLFSFSLLNPLHGQDNSIKYTIHLIDGSTLRATILDETTSHTRIKIISGDELLLDNHLIKRKEKDNNKGVVLSEGYTIQREGRYNLISVGLLAGQGAGRNEGTTVGLSLIHYVHGMQLNKQISIGGGIGFDVYDKGYLPIYADFRGYLFESKFSTFYSMQAGYSLAFWDLDEDDGEPYSGGLMLYPSIGIRWATPRKTNLLMEVGYRMQWAKREFDWNDQQDEIIYRRLGLRLGFLF